MCDILIALPDSTSTGSVVFGKNSDRPAGECQVLYDSAAESRRPPGTVRCAFVEVPDVASPLRTVGCRPYWCWGYETGMNEAGVVGGNTAIYTRGFWKSENQGSFGLTGMELLRLGLERERTAAGVVESIAELLDQYGQWAPAVLGKGPPEGCYENAFLIADANEAWIMETTGCRFAAQRFTTGVHSLSNQLTIRERWTRASEDLGILASQQGWWRAEDGPLDFALAFSDHEHYARQVSHLRWKRTGQLLREGIGQIDAATMIGFLRDHYEGTFIDGPQFSQYDPDFLSVCMHDSPAGFTWGNTATSFVVEIESTSMQSNPFWFCYQPPCSSVFAVQYFGEELPATVAAAGTAGLRSESPLDVPRDSFDNRSMWWRLYRIVDTIREAPGERREQVRALFDPIEQKSVMQVRALKRVPGPDRHKLLQQHADDQLRAIEAALDELEDRWKLV